MKDLHGIIINITNLKQLTEDEKIVIQEKFKSDEMEARKIYYALYELEKHILKEKYAKTKLSFNKFQKIASKKYGSTHQEDYIRKLVNAEKVNKILGEKLNSVSETVIRPITTLLNEDNKNEEIRKVWKSATNHAGSNKVKKHHVDEAMVENGHEKKHRSSKKSRLESENNDGNRKSNVPTKFRLESENGRPSNHQVILSDIVPLLERDYKVAKRVSRLIYREFSHCLNRQNAISYDLEVIICS